jgi:hypothetical protein
LDGERRTFILETVNRPPRTRWTALLAAVLFLLSGAGDAFGAHACPHHTAITAPQSAGQVAGAEHGGHAAHESHGPAAPADHDGHDGHDACTCGGVCPVSAGPAPLAAPGLVPVPPALLAEAPAALPDGTALPPRLLAHLLPFAQAPPLPA